MRATALALLHTYRRTALLLAATVALALVAAGPVARLADRFAVTPGPGAAPGLTWRSPAESADQARQRGVEALSSLLGASAIGVVLVAGLTLLALAAARTPERDLEVRVRRAVGASRRTLLGSLVLEGSAIAGLGLLGGAVPAAILIGAAREDWPGVLRAGSPWLLALLGGAMGLLVVLGALFPILFAPRREVEEPAGGGITLALPAGLLGLTLAVLATGLLMGRDAARQMSAPGPSPHPVRVVRLALDPAAPAPRAGRLTELLDRIGSVPGVSSVGVTSPGAVLGLGTVSKVKTDCGVCPEGGLPLRFHIESATHQYVSADSFLALGVRVVAGRGITAADSPDTEPVAVVNRRLANEQFQDGEALGRRLMVGNDGDTWYRVVGVVDAPPGAGLGAGLQPPYTVYLSILQHPVTSADLVVTGSRGYSARGVARVLRQVPGIVAARDAVPVRALVRAERAPLLWFTRAIRLEGWVMLLVALIGSFTLARLWVRSLAPEIALRRSVGAVRRRVLLGLVVRAALAALAGVAVGLELAPGLWQSVRGLLPGLGGFEPGIVGPVALLLVVALVLGALLPARALLARPPARIADPV